MVYEKEGWWIPTINYSNNNNLPPNGVRVVEPLETQVYTVNTMEGFFTFVVGVCRHIVQFVRSSGNIPNQTGSGISVFIAFKQLAPNGERTRDSQIAELLYLMLQSYGIRTFFSMVSLEILGAAAFKNTINSALDEATVMIVVGTSKENICARWVQYEWGSFHQDMLDGKKGENARIFTYLENMNVEELPRELRGFEGFQHSEMNLHALCRRILNG